MVGKTWCMIQSKPHKENQLSAYFEAQGFEVFCPTIHVQPANPRSSKNRPYFSRCVFVHVDLEEVGTSALQWAPGAIDAAQFEGYAVTVPDNVISEIKRWIAHIKADNEERSNSPKQGDAGWGAHGSLAGYEAIFDLRLNGSERTQVLLELLGHLEKADANVEVTKSQLQDDE